MRADTLTLKALFQKDVRYVIPTFQRPYVWNQDDQWEPLWNDVRNTAERFLEELAAAEGDVPVAEERAGTHFMGAVVLQQEPTVSAEIETRLVIDGQQRLTTTQILLDATQEVFEEVGAEPEARRVARLVLNAYVDDDEAFKLWPTSLDQGAFRSAMRNGASTDGFEDSLIVQAHEFFHLQVSEWIEAADSEEERAQRIHGLETALFGLLEMVVIDLATADDAFVIFETLNARGTPLLASDLVKNYVLQTAASRGVDGEGLYEREWQAFDEAWWREEIRQGRIVRPRIDVFLNYWLVMHTGDEVQSNEVFPRFREYVEASGDSIEDVVASLRRVGDIFRGFDKADPSSRLATFLYRWEVIDARTMTPLLLWLYSQPDSVISDSERSEAIELIESFLIRRMICRLTTKDYNRLSVEVLARLQKAPAGSVVETLASFLSGQASESRRWPTDRDLEQAVLDLPLYRLLTRGRLRLVLEAIEERLRGKFAEESNVARGALQIEHVMPRKWTYHWPLDDVADKDQAHRDRDRLLHSLGNLTLVNDKLNPKLSNAPWASKREALADHTIMYLNKDLLKSAGDTWDEDAIRNRGRALTSIVASIWPAG